MATSTKDSSTTASEVELLKQQIEELKKAMLEPKQETVKVKETRESSDKVSPDDYIKVMSLLPYSLNLSTREGGQGSTKKFTKFGEIKRIVYHDLVEIMENHTNFLEAGYFYIMNPDVIRQHGLDDVYAKILTKEKIKRITEASDESCVELYKNANEKQQEIIIQLLCDNIIENPSSVNLNVIDKLSREAGVDILNRVNEIKKSSAVEDEDEEE